MATKKTNSKAEARLPGFFDNDDGSGIRPVKSTSGRKSAGGKKSTGGKKK